MRVQGQAMAGIFIPLLPVVRFMLRFIPVSYPFHTKTMILHPSAQSPWWDSMRSAGGPVEGSASLNRLLSRATKDALRELLGIINEGIACQVAQDLAAMASSSSTMAVREALAKRAVKHIKARKRSNAILKTIFFLACCGRLTPSTKSSLEGLIR